MAVWDLATADPNYEHCCLNKLLKHKHRFEEIVVWNSRGNGSKMQRLPSEGKQKVDGKFSLEFPIFLLIFFLSKCSESLSLSREKEIRVLA